MNKMRHGAVQPSAMPALSATNDSTKTCLTSIERYASLFMGDDLLHVALMETETSTLPPLRRSPLVFTIANYGTKGYVDAYPAINRWAILNRPYGTGKPMLNCVERKTEVVSIGVAQRDD